VSVRVDVAFTRLKVAVFVDGCFWHRCPEHGTIPRRNQGYWLPKLKANVQRDRRVSQALSRDGWMVIRVWEHEPVDDAVTTVEHALALAAQTS
jgi:DNA mismatch endonuclease (patch repair protein)